jgi:putative SOS response-associated peptidase YedK
VRWRIGLASRRAFAVAGIWDRWEDPAGGSVVHSFSLLTVNADGHPVLARMHRPGDEKRSIVPVAPEQYDDWLGAMGRDLVRAPGVEALFAEPSPRDTPANDPVP